MTTARIVRFFVNLARAPGPGARPGVLWFASYKLCYVSITELGIGQPPGHLESHLFKSQQQQSRLEYSQSLMSISLVFERSY
jgi:hypothetical protein